MRSSLLVLSYGKLITNGSAGTTVMCGLVRAALLRGIDVTYAGLIPTGETPGNNADLIFSPPENAEGKLVTCLVSYQRAQIRRIPLVNDIAVSVDQSLFEVPQSIPCELKEKKFDGLIAFDDLAIRLGSNFIAPTKVAIIGDPAGQRLLWSAEHEGDIKLKIKARLTELFELPYWKHILSPTWKVAMFGTQHSSTWARRLGRPVLDLRPMIPPTEPARLEKPADELVMAFGGTLEGTASRFSMDFFKGTFLPWLKKQSPLRKRLIVVGRCPPKFRSLFDGFGEVQLLGRVDSFEKELDKANLFLLPMNYPVGVRTRLCAALQAGCFSICDESTLAGMPELENCAAVAIARNPEDFIRKIEAYPQDPETRRNLQNAASEFYANHYLDEKSAAPLLELALEREGFRS